MTMTGWTDKLNHLPTPCYVIDEEKLINNLERLNTIKKATNCTILLALKGYSTYSTFPLLSPVIDGVTASSIYEARLGYEEFSGHVHGHSIAMSQSEYKQFESLCSHISFNSISQYQQFKSLQTKPLSLGLRINPNISTVKTDLYNPCSKYSRLGIPIEQLDPVLFNEIDGLHFHALCEQNTNDLEKVLQKIKHTYGNKLKNLQWMNWGGGQRLTHNTYNTDHLIELINEWQSNYNVKIILEPGDAIVYDCGYYVSKVLDIINNQKQIAICDISATCHMPDILEYPYRPQILNTDPTYAYSYILSGNTCLAGDIIGDYSFKTPLSINDIIVFSDMAQYTLVKTTNFNGIKQPSIAIIDKEKKINLVKQSHYFNFKERLS